MPVVFIGVGVALGAIVLGFFYYTWQNELNKTNADIKRLTAQKTELMQTKQQVEAFEKQKAILQQRVNTIEQLQRDRTGGQELLDMVANTVSRTENLWPPPVQAKPASAPTPAGAAKAPAKKG